MIKNKKAALELSVGTIVVVVLAMSMLILGMVLVRTIMCGAVGLTGDVNDKVRGQINDLFESSAGEIVCVGSSGEPVSFVPGQLNIVYCSVNAQQTAEYDLQVKDLSSGGIISDSELEEWVVGNKGWTGSVSPNDNNPRKVLRLQIPENAPKDLITVQVEISRDNTLISTQTLDFEVERRGFFKSTIC